MTDPQSIDTPPALPPRPNEQLIAMAHAVPVRRSVWPTAIGIISIIFGGLGLACAPLNLVNFNVNPVYKDLYSRLPSWVLLLTNASQVVSFALGAVLLVAGISALRRKRLALALHMVYALTGLAMNAISLMLILRADLSGLASAEAAGFRWGAVGGSILGAAYPVFLVIWFCRGAIRRDVAGWGGRKNDPPGPYQS